jgi:glycogen debranching enzyme
MSHSRAPLIRTAAAACLLVLLPSAAAWAKAARPPLAFDVRTGGFLNYFLRQGPVAANLVLRSGAQPRILVAFPAGDSGVGLWFAPQPAHGQWRVVGRLEGAHARDSKGRPLYGISASVTITDPVLRIHQAVLSSIRVLRDYGSLGKLPRGIETAPERMRRTLVWARNRLDGAAGYRLAVQVLQGAIRGRRILAADNGRIELRITALTGERPLTPLAGRALLRRPSAGNAAARDTLTFLAYRQKFLAGSWRFDTYFGRDTLMSLRLLMPALSASAVEDGLNSVLSRLSPQGEVAHEEDIGEQAVLDHRRDDGTLSAAPVYHYQMIDEDYLLAPVAAAWLLDPRERAHSAAYLAAAVGGPMALRGSRGAALVRNLRFVLRSAERFARGPVYTDLIGLKPGVPAGDWRDSTHGLGGGHYPYDVNAVLVPEALHAAARLDRSGLLTPYLTEADRTLFAHAAAMARLWRARAPSFFEVKVAHAAAVRDIQAYSASQGIAPAAAVDALGRGGERFYALALTAGGRPIPVMQSDEGYELLFGRPDPKVLDRIVAVLMRPFPAGLMTGAGMVVADPVFAPPRLQRLFTRHDYHGTVIWSWQQALFAAGLARQLERRDLPPPVRARLIAAQHTLWSAIEATRSMANSELWSWSYAAGRYRVRPFGSSSADATEADAAQLWSTVYLAVKPPRFVQAGR